jgi:micrococcal nuclease
VSGLAVRRRSVRLLVVSLLVASAAGCASGERGDAGPAAGTEADSLDSSLAPPPDGGVEVLEVVDGDTLEVRIDGSVERLRLLGVNAPEEGECFGDEATTTLRDLLGDGAVTLVADVSDRDQYDRLLRYVVAEDGTAVNEALVAAGAARSRSYPPDTAQQDALDAAEDGARAAGRGLWADGACGAVDPAAATGDVVLVASVADPPGSDEADPNAETVTVANRGTTAADLSSWVLKDTSASHRFTFPAGFELAGGAEVVVHTGCGTDTATDLHWCNQRSLVWNNDGDTAYLEDPNGNTVSVLDV